MRNLLFGFVGLLVIASSIYCSYSGNYQTLGTFYPSPASSDQRAASLEVKGDIQHADPHEEFSGRLVYPDGSWLSIITVKAPVHSRYEDYYPTIEGAQYLGSYAIRWRPSSDVMWSRAILYIFEPQVQAW